MIVFQNKSPLGKRIYQYLRFLLVILSFSHITTAMYNSFNIFLKIVGILIFGVLVILGIKVNNPELMIIGQWEEKDWAYEKLDDKSLLELGIENFKKHEAETWVFKENNTVEFNKGDRIIALAEWHIKGRGHILKIDHSDGTEELFDIKELNNSELVLNFDIGMETRGIAKLIFAK